MAKAGPAATSETPPVSALVAFLLILGTAVVLQGVGLSRSNVGLGATAALYLVFFANLLSRNSEGAKAILFLALPIDPLIRVWGSTRYLAFFYGVALLMLTNMGRLRTQLRKMDSTVAVILGLTAWMMVSVTWSIDRWEGFTSSVAMLGLVVAYLGPVCLFRDLPSLRRGLSAMVMGGMAMLACLVALLPESYAGRLGNMKSTLAGGDTSIHIAVPAGVALYLGLTSRGRPRFLYLGSAVALSIGTTMTVCRGSVVALLIVVLCMAVGGGGKQILVRLAIAGAFIAAILYSAKGLSDADIERGIERTVGVADDPDAAFTGRLDLWKVAWAMVTDRPMTGVGAGAYATEFDNFAEKANLGTKWRGKAMGAHNVLLRTAAEGGFIAAFAFAYFLIAAIRRAWQVRREQGPLGRLALGLTLASVAAAQVAVAFTYIQWFGIGLAGFVAAQRGLSGAAPKKAPSPASPADRLALSVGRRHLPVR